MSTFLTPEIVAKIALPILQDQIVAVGQVYTDYSAEYVNVGDTITIRKPAQFVANEFNGTTAVQNIDETGVSLKIDKWKDVSFAITGRERALDISDLSERVIRPAIVPIVTAIEDDILALYKSCPYNYGTAGVTPASLEAFSNVAGVLDKNKTPDDGQKCLILNNTSTIKLRPLLTVLGGGNAGAAAPSNAMERARLAYDLYGMKPFTSQRVASHTAGVPGGSPVITVDVSVSALLGTIAAGGNAGTFNKGDLFAVATSTQQFVVTEDLVLTAGGGTLKFYPAMTADVTSKAVTVVASHSASMAFHKNAIALAVRQLELPDSGPKAAYQFDPQTGIGVRVVNGWDYNAQREVMSIGVLYGCAMILPEFACRVIG